MEFLQKNTFKGITFLGNNKVHNGYIDKEQPYKEYLKHEIIKDKYKRLKTDYILLLEDYKKAYEEQSGKLEGAFVPTKDARPSMDETIQSDMFYANQGGLATVIPKFNKGGVNYLPSKTDHNENDYNNYVRAEGYVEDGAGNGDKDEDTMLAQLADGEFVSRADAVLGAGILSGGDPKSYKSMRKAGADYFYDQQKKLKRIYDLVNENKTNTIQ